jgi:hypothetical protein
MSESSSHLAVSSPDRHRPQVGRVALAGARLALQLTPEARKRQRAGTRAADGTRGKSAHLAAAKFGVSTRAVEQGLLLLRCGYPQLVADVESGRLSLSAAVRQIAQIRAANGDQVVPVVDRSGRRLPSRLMAAFQTANDLRRLMQRLTAMARELEAIAVRPGGELLARGAAWRHLSEAEGLLFHAEPVDVCPDCGGTDARQPPCRQCGGRGWIPMR